MTRKIAAIYRGNVLRREGVEARLGVVPIKEVPCNFASLRSVVKVDVCRCTNSANLR